MPKALKRCPKCRKSPNLVTLVLYQCISSISMNLYMFSYSINLDQFLCVWINLSMFSSISIRLVLSLCVWINLYGDTGFVFVTLSLSSSSSTSSSFARFLRDATEAIAGPYIRTASLRRRQRLKMEREREGLEGEREREREWERGRIREVEYWRERGSIEERGWEGGRGVDRSCKNARKIDWKRLGRGFFLSGGCVCGWVIKYT